MRDQRIGTRATLALHRLYVSSVPSDVIFSEARCFSVERLRRAFHTIKGLRGHNLPHALGIELDNLLHVAHVLALTVHQYVAFRRLGLSMCKYAGQNPKSCKI